MRLSDRPVRGASQGMPARGLTGHEPAFPGTTRAVAGRIGHGGRRLLPVQEQQGQGVLPHAAKMTRGAAPVLTRPGPLSERTLPHLSASFRILTRSSPLPAGSARQQADGARAGRQACRAMTVALRPAQALPSQDSSSAPIAVWARFFLQKCCAMLQTQAGKAMQDIRLQDIAVRGSPCRSWPD